ncbi:hypothetical protein [Methylobacterium sp. OT2]|uniref:hypothetical protein n=3 Tax=unclassified Methylobacterium TaxID=2615210 RepID=UPI0005B26F1D|nr:hypothetical protein [Methylobacterium sp. OT2]SEG31070.1 hypothetical protein SAMN04488144_113122 [Methylobacterium sp. 190mf]
MMSERGRVMEAVEALIAAGHSVEPLGDDFAFWIVDGKGLSDGELLDLADSLGLMSPTTEKLF